MAGTIPHSNGVMTHGLDDEWSRAEVVCANGKPRPVVLYLVHRVPYPPDKGDRIRNYNVLRAVARFADVHLICLADEPVSDSVRAALDHCCTRVAVIPATGWGKWLRGGFSLLRGRTVTEGVFYSPAFARTLREWTRTTPYHAVLTSSSGMVSYLDLPELRSIPAVVDMVDVDSEKWLDYALAARWWKAWLFHKEGWRLRKLEKQLPERARAVLVVSEAEATLYRRFCAAGSVHAVTNGVALDYFRPMPRHDEAGLVFVGALDYHPNVDGLDWFCREIWPELRRRHPHLSFEIVGRRPGASVQRLTQTPGVRLIGQVADVRPHVAGAAVAVVPVRIARGVQNKVLEGLAMSKAVVATPQSIAGLRAQSGVHLLSASTPGEWLESLDRLLRDVELRRLLGAAGRRYVEEHHRWERCLDPLGPILGLSDPTSHP